MMLMARIIMDKRGDGIYVSLVILGLVSMVVLFYVVHVRKPRDLKIEYNVELVNEDTAKIYSYLSGKTYVVPMDSIQEAFIIDNL